MTTPDDFPPDRKPEDIWSGDEQEAADLDRLQRRSIVMKERSKELIAASAALIKRHEQRKDG